MIGHMQPHLGLKVHLKMMVQDRGILSNLAAAVKTREAAKGGPQTSPHDDPGRK